MVNNLHGRAFGLLVVLHATGSDKKGNMMWLCRCICGSDVVVRGYSLTGGGTVSCGCWRRLVSATRGKIQSRINSRNRKPKAGVKCFGGEKVRKIANTQSGNTNRAKAAMKKLAKLGVK
jgi:hypothetical protein